MNTIPRVWTVRMLVVLLVLVMALRLVLTARDKSPTVDEFAHLPAGYVHLTRADFSLYNRNPPLVRMLAAAPLLAMRPVCHWPVGNPRQSWSPWQFGTQFMDGNRSRYDQMFFCGRLSIVVLTILLALLVFAWSRSLWGEWGGLLSLFLFSFSPNILAHGCLATVDVGFALFFAFALYRFWCLCRRPSWGNVIWTGLALGLALLSKFTGCLLVVVLGLLVLWPALRGHRVGPAWPGERRIRGLTPRLLYRALGNLCAILLVALVLLNVGYGFKGTLRPFRSYRFTSRFMQQFHHPLLRWLPAPLPSDCIEGFDIQKTDAERGEFENYLCGEWSREGWWYYFIVACAIKVPVPALMLLVAAAARGRRRAHRRDGPLPVAVLLVPGVLLLVVLSFLNNLNIGIRYLLPAFPLAHVFAGSLVGGHVLRGRAAGLLLALLCVWYAVSSLAAHPHYLSYFNETVGARNGHKYLLDSNVDWGQELKGLKRYLDEKGAVDVALAYFGHVDPALYGIEYVPPNCASRSGRLAVSANYRHGMSYPMSWLKEHPAPPAYLRERLHGRQPCDVIGSALFIFDLGEADERQ